MNRAISYTYKSEMGFSHSELLRNLPSAVEPFIVSKSDHWSYSMTYKNQQAVLMLGPERIRKIASIEIPITDVVIEFGSFTESQYLEFIEKFKKYMHRGGG